nr:MetS family NSS transporter small subunit [uncultured Cetobacterium sp.]
MNTGALIMMLIGCIAVWGGLFITLGIALKQDKK